MNVSYTHLYKKVPSVFSGRDMGRWFIIAKLKNRTNGNCKFLCRCECGTIVLKPGPDIVPSRPCIVCINTQEKVYVNRISFREEDFFYGYYPY